MDIFVILREEHQLIHQFLDQLQTALIRIEKGEKIPVRFLEKAGEFARTFADKYHHFKEEYLLFSLLAMKKRGELDGAIESLRYSHERGRNLINQLAAALPGYEKGQEASGLMVIESLAAYLALLKAHIHKEDHFFFLLAAKEISLQESSELEEASPSWPVRHENLKNEFREGLIDLCRQTKTLGAKFYICSGSMARFNIAREELVEEVDRSMGLTTFLTATAYDQVLFI